MTFVSFFFKFAKETLVGKSSGNSTVCFSMEVGTPVVHLKQAYMF